SLDGGQRNAGYKNVAFGRTRLADLLPSAFTRAARWKDQCLGRPLSPRDGFRCAVESSGHKENDELCRSVNAQSVFASSAKQSVNSGGKRNAATLRWSAAWMTIASMSAKKCAVRRL